VQRRHAALVLALLALIPSASALARSTAEAPAWHVVALGDSGASGKGDPSRLAWSGRYGRLLRQRLKHKVVVTNLAAEGKSSADLLRELRRDPTTRAAVKSADIILFGSTAGASLNLADANYDAGRCQPEMCYTEQLTPWAKQFEAIVATARSLHGRKKTVLRGVTDANVVPGAQDVIPPNATVELGLFQARTINAAICASLRRHRGRCIDVLTAFNGPSGTEDAYAKGLMNKVECCYASGKGQQLIAELLFNTGLKGLR
jgi:hypothetical protein